VILKLWSTMLVDVPAGPMPVPLNVTAVPAGLAPVFQFRKLLQFFTASLPSQVDWAATSTGNDVATRTTPAIRRARPHKEEKGVFIGLEQQRRGHPVSRGSPSPCLAVVNTEARDL
jgi:hypothetical protein